MSFSTFVSAAAFLATAQQALAQEITGTFPAVPMASKRFDYPAGIPYQADTETGLVRGLQYGYNMCNSTTEGPESKCQTAFVNSLEDFCLWGPPEPNSVVGNTEGESVAWCTKPGRGTRLIPQGALQGVQFMRTPDYIQVVGFIDQVQISLQADDWGGEMDPHGADLRGNPLGGLVYSNAWTGNQDGFQQVLEWHNFMGGNAFCFKACDPAGPNAAHFCEHIFDRIGCAYNAPHAAKNGTFESCQGDNQDFPGVYTENGETKTFTQPPEGVEPNPPYTARIPASSNCQQFESASIYAALATVMPTTGPAAAGGASKSGTPPAGATSGSNPSASRAGAGASQSAGAAAGNDASAVAIGMFSTLLGVAFSVLFMA